MARRSGPKKGSRSFWHRRRATRVVPRMRHWHTGTGLLGFPSYKAGMKTISIIDDRETPTKGQEVTRAVTIVETPPIFVNSIIGFKESPYGLKPFCEVAATEAPKEIKKRVRVPKAAKKKLEDLAGCDEYRVRVWTQPFKTNTGKKQPEAVEIGLGGTAEEQLEFAKGVFGKEVTVNEVIEDGAFVDVIGVTKGKGWQGVVKRFGVKLQIRKATKKRRHGGPLGPERQAKVMYTIPRAGQMGYHRRTDRNKRVISAGEKLDYAFHCYGPIRGSYLVIDGSIPGPAKRFILLRKRDKPAKKPEVKQGVN